MPYLLNNLRELVDHLNLEYYLIAELEDDILVLAFSLWTGIVCTLAKAAGEGSSSDYIEVMICCILSGIAI